MTVKVSELLFPLLPEATFVSNPLKTLVVNLIATLLIRTLPGGAMG